MQPRRKEEKHGGIHSEHKGREARYEAGCTRAHGGVRQGNEFGGVDKEPGLFPAGEQGANRPSATATARKSTGINSEKRNPIDPNSPNLPPN